MNKPYINLCKKWDVTSKEIEEFMNFVVTNKCVGDWYGDINVLFAALDLMCSGDVSPREDQNGD